MERVRKGEVEIRVWLKESEEKFRCPICGKSLSSGSLRSKCYHCGQNYQAKPLTDLVRR